MARFTKKALERLKANRDARKRKRQTKSKKAATPKRIHCSERKRAEPDSNGVLRLDLPAELTNGNTGQSKHWGSTVKLRNEYLEVLTSCYYRAAPPDHQQHIKVTRVLGKGQRLWDADSILRGSAKQLIDSLVDHGFMHDDGPKWLVSATGTQDDTQRENGPRIIVELSPA